MAAIRSVKNFQLDAAAIAVAENSVAYDYASHSDPSGDLQSFAQAAVAADHDLRVVSGLALSDGTSRPGSRQDRAVDLSAAVDRDRSQLGRQDGQRGWRSQRRGGGVGLRKDHHPSRLARAGGGHPYQPAERGLRR